MINTEALENVCDITSGQSFRGKIAEDPNGNVSVVQLRDVNELSGIDFNSLIRTNVKLRDSKTDNFLRKGDVLCVSKGPRLYSAYLDEVPEGVLASFHLSILRVKADRNQILPEFVAWSLNNSQRYFHQNSQGSTVTHMSKSVLEKLPIKLPPIEIQQQVVQLEKLKNEEESLLEKIVSLRSELTKAIQNKLVSRSNK